MSIVDHYPETMKGLSTWRQVDGVEITQTSTEWSSNSLLLILLTLHGIYHTNTHTWLTLSSSHWI